MRGFLAVCGGVFFALSVQAGPPYVQGNTFTAETVVVTVQETLNTGAGTNAVVTESGVNKTSGSTETWAVGNSGAGVCSISTDGQLISTVSTGTAPLAVSSTTLVSNLNADMLDGQDSTAFATAASLSNYVLKTGSTMTGSLTMNTGGGTDTMLSEGGLDRSSGATETIAIQNSGAGRADVTLDGTLLLGSLTADPTGANGLSYYNTTSGKFRCYQSGAWKDCDTTGGAGSVDIGSSIPSGTPGRVLFVGAGPDLDEDASLFWDDASKYLVVGGGTGGYPIHVIRSADAELVSAVSNTDATGTSAQSTLRATNTAGYFADLGMAGAGFTTVGAIDANDAYVRSNAPKLKIVNTTGSVGLYPGSTEYLLAGSSAVAIPSGINLVVGGGSGTHEIHAAKSEDGDVVVGVSNESAGGTSARAVLLGSNTTGYFTEVGVTGAGFTTSGAQVADVGIVRSNAPSLRVINTTGGINFYPGSSTSVMDMTSTQVFLPAGVAFVVTESMTFTKSTDSQLQMAVSNTDATGTSAQSTLRTTNTTGYFADLGMAGAGFTTVGAIDANDAYVRSNAPKLKIVNTTGSVGLYPGSTEYLLAGSSAVAIPSGINLVVGGGSGTHEIHAAKSEDGDVVVGVSNESAGGTSARAVLLGSNTTGYFTEIGMVGAGFTTSGPQSADDGIVRSNAPELKVINTSGGVSFYPGGASTAVASMTSTQVAMPATANTGTCTLDGAATATCTATTFSGATCVCSDTDPSTLGVAAIACANSGGTLTATSSVTLDTSVIAYHCF